MTRPHSVPRVDLERLRAPDSPARDTECRRLRDGLVEFGFVRVVGHRVDPSLVDDCYAAFGAFFALDDAAKMRCSGVAGGQRGFTPYGVEHARDHSVPDLKEFFHVGRELPAKHPLRGRYPENLWPAEIPNLPEVSRALFDALDACARELLEGLALSVGVERDAFASMLHHGNSILRALHYPAFDFETARIERALRAAPHEDINLITLLTEATDAGLEILTRDGTWLPVEPQPGEIVADAGDMLSRVTNGRIPATTHRVVASPESAKRDRYTLPFFAHPYPDCDLSVMDAFLDPGAAPRWPPITAETFLHQRLTEIGLVDALE